MTDTPPSDAHPRPWRVVNYEGSFAYIFDAEDGWVERHGFTPALTTFIVAAVNGAERVRARCEVEASKYDESVFMTQLEARASATNAERAAILRALNGDTDE